MRNGSSPRPAGSPAVVPADEASRVQTDGLGFRVQGFCGGFRVQTDGLWCRALGFWGVWGSDKRFRV